MKRLFAIGAAMTAALLAAGLTTATPAGAVHEGTTYVATLGELNNSGASGDVYVEVSADGETMTVTLNAVNLNLDGPHAMHIHAPVSNGTVSASSCPTMADDANGDGVLTVLEGAPRYGGVQVSLTTTGDTSPASALAVSRFPAGNTVNYYQTNIAIPDVLKPNLGKVHVVVHGIDENGDGVLNFGQQERSSLTPDFPREATAPAACGTLTATAAGAIQTGAGGLAESTSAAPELAVTGGLAIALAAATIGRRRSSD